MKTVGIIPARYQSSRLPGKPLVDICGKPMIWWVYQEALRVREIDEIFVATDDDRISRVCGSYGMKVLMTSSNHRTHIERIHEASNMVEADYFVVICGDEPLIKAEAISHVIPNKNPDGKMFVKALMRHFSDPAETIDPGNIKIVTNNQDECIYLSRTPIPYPYKTVQFKYKKIVGIECYDKRALDYFVSKEPGELERIEDITLLRFVEHGYSIQFKLIHSDSISVDTEKDLEKVRAIMSQRLEIQSI